MLSVKTVVECPIDDTERDIEELYECGGCVECQYEGCISSVYYSCNHPSLE